MKQTIIPKLKRVYVLFRYYLKNNKGSKKRISDPENFKNWGSPNNPNKKFIYDKNYSLFLKEKKLLDNKLKFLKR